MTTPARTAHAIAMRLELDLRRQLDDAVRALRQSGATPEAVLEYLAACATAGAVLHIDATAPSG